MPRAMRRFEEGSFYHVYNRGSGGLLPFLDEGVAQGVVDLLRQVSTRDDLVILGWFLLTTHP